MKTLFSTILVLCFFQTAQAQQCFDLFYKYQSQTFDKLSRIPQQKTPDAPNIEIPEHGLIIHSENHSGLESVQKLISQRDGTYPILIDNYGNIAIDNRLPRASTPQDTPFLGTHRGLFRHLTTTFRETPQIVFAGELRVIGGQVKSLIDQSGSFHIRISRQQKNSPYHLRLIEENQTKLNFVRDYLLSLVLIDGSAKIINFQKQFKDYPPEQRQVGHVKALDSARFEVVCRSNPACWDIHQSIEPFLRTIVAQGGEAYLMDHMLEFLKRDRVKASNFFQHMALILNEGTVDVMSYPGMMTPGSERHLLFMDFVENLPLFITPQ